MCARTRVGLLSALLALAGAVRNAPGVEVGPGKVAGEREERKEPRLPEIYSRPVPVPEGAHVTLVLDREQYFLGENILVHYCVENRGAKPFLITMGGDYRFASRALRFRVTAKGEDGQQAADPDPSGFCLGGAVSAPEVKPGEKFWRTLRLIRYCRIDKPGIYTLRVSHDLGWKETKDTKIPFGEAKLKLLMPAPEQARQVVADMRRLPKPESGRSGERDSPYRDFSALQYPVYLPILYPAAERGGEESLMAIGYIPSSEATQKLIGLLDYPEEDYLLKVAQALNMRLPDPELEGKAPPHSIWQNNQDEHRRWLVKQAWRPEFAADVLVRARRLMGSKNEELQDCGAFMIQCLGGASDLSHVIRCLDGAVAKTRQTPHEEGVRPPPRGACQALIRTARLLLERGAKPPAKPVSLGESVVFAVALGSQPSFRPEGWVEACARLLQHETAYVREVALEQVPEPMPAPLAALLPRLLADSDLHVLMAACRAVEQNKAPSLREPVLRLVVTAKEEELLREAVDAAQALDAPLESLQTLVGRLDEPEVGPMCYHQILDRVVDHRGGTFSMQLGRAAAAALKTRWTQFMRDHAEAIRAGRRFEVGSKELAPELLARGDAIQGEKTRLANPLKPGEEDHGQRSIESRSVIPLDKKGQDEK